MPRRNLKARKRHRGPSSQEALSWLGYVSQREKRRARRAGVVLQLQTAQRPGTRALNEDGAVRPGLHDRDIPMPTTKPANGRPLGTSAAA